MKKIAIALLAAGLLLLGLWCTIRRKPGALPPSGEEQAAFRVEAVARGTLLTYSDPQTPLRSLRWLPGATCIAQVVTQSDRQQVSLFKNGAFASFLVPKPAGVREGFFRIAELRDALVTEGDVALLLYAIPGTEELPLVLALDLAAKEIRWIHRAAGEKLVLTEGPEGVAYLFGPSSPPVRLPLALASGERTSPTGVRSAAKTIDLPPEVLDITDLKPTGAWTFLLAHKGGLSAYLGSKGWVHHPAPEGAPAWFPQAGGTLGGSDKRFWWQPFPGALVQVLGDGTPKALWRDLPTAEPFPRDAALLRLLGSDGDGMLWFELAVPSTPPPPAESAPADAPAGAAPTTTLTLDDWPAYAAQGLDRIYRWDSRKRVLQRFPWASLTVPKGFSRPVRGQRLRPESGSLLLEQGSSAWLVPLTELAFGEPAPTGKALQGVP